jgi:hypothetical protein
MDTLRMPIVAGGIPDDDADPDDDEDPSTCHLPLPFLLEQRRPPRHPLCPNIYSNKWKNTRMEWRVLGVTELVQKTPDFQAVLPGSFGWQ